MSSKGSNSSGLKGQSNKPEKKNSQGSKFKGSSDPDVVVSLPGGLKYRLPGKRQRVIIGSIVVGLNALLVISVAVYFYSPAFRDFIYNFGR